MGIYDHIDLLILFLARQSSKFSIERAIKIVGNPYSGWALTIVRLKRVKNLKNNSHSFFMAPGSDITQCHDGSLRNYLEIKETLLAMLLYTFT
jgi:hypothetical protein